MKLNNGNESSADKGVAGDGVKTLLEVQPHLRSDLTRLIIQSLQRVGYVEAATTLERESGLQLESSMVTEFKQSVLSGNWENVERLITEMGMDSDDELKAAKFLIFEQKFLELLERNEHVKALMCLRQDLTPLKQDSEKLHKLSTFVMSRSREDLLKRAEWSGAGMESRQKLLVGLQKFISPSLMIPERRLETIIEQAVTLQQMLCSHHNTGDTVRTLFQDHFCDKTLFPRETKDILIGHIDEVWYLRFSNDGTMLASASKDTTVIIWDVSASKPAKLHSLVGHRDAVSFLSWSPDDSKLLTCGNDVKIKLWDVKSGTLIRTISQHAKSVTSSCWHPDGNKFLTASIDHKMYLWDLEGNQLEKFDGVLITDMVFANDGKRVFATNSDKIIFVYYIGESKREEFLQESDTITSLSLSHDGKYLLVNISKQEIHLWDLETKELKQTYVGHKQGRYVIRSCFGGQNESFIASGSEDNNVYIWKRNNGSLLEVLSGHKATVNCVAWNSKNHLMLASASDDHTIRLWAPGPNESNKNGNSSTNTHTNNSTTSSSNVSQANDIFSSSSPPGNTQLSSSSSGSSSASSSP